MPDKQTVTVTAFHPYPIFYWEAKPAATGVWGDIENYAGYSSPQPDGSGQGLESVEISAVVGQEAVLRCVIGRAHDYPTGNPVSGDEGTITTDEIPVSIGVLTWDTNLACRRGKAD